MSEFGGPRGHPGRCNDEFERCDEREKRPRQRPAALPEILANVVMLGLLISGAVGLIYWWVR